MGSTWKGKKEGKSGRRGPAYEVTEDGQDLVRVAEAMERQVQPLLDSAHQAVPTVKVSAGSWVTYHLCRNVARIVEDSLYVQLEWTAPGGDYDKGKGEYEFHIMAVFAVWEFSKCGSGALSGGISHRANNFLKGRISVAAHFHVQKNNIEPRAIYRKEKKS